jgi:uncharacterized delta-60 repeat protein
MLLWRAVFVGVLATLVAVGLAAAAPGTVDTTFSQDGWLRSRDFFGDFQEYMPKGAEDIALQRDGKIVATGELESGYESPFGAFRYTADGDLDRTFGEGGWVDTDVGDLGHAHAVAIQKDGKIVLAGDEFEQIPRCTVLVRYLPDGSLDKGFGRSGIVRTCRRSLSPLGTDVAVQAGGKIVTLALSFHDTPQRQYYDLAVLRYRADGRLDRSFSHDGIAIVSGFGQWPQALAVQANGSIVVAGSEYGANLTDNFVVARLRQNGAPDRAFGRGGLRKVDFAHRDDHADAVALDGRGRIVVAGQSSVGQLPRDRRLALVSLRANGNVDRRFGRRLTKFGPHGCGARAVAIQRDGRVVAAGVAYDDPSWLGGAWVVARYGPNGRIDGSFGHRGFILGDFGTGFDWAGALALQPDGKIVVGGQVYEDQAVARYLPR